MRLFDRSEYPVPSITFLAASRTPGLRHSGLFLVKQLVPANADPRREFTTSINKDLPSHTSGLVASRPNVRVCRPGTAASSRAPLRSKHMHSSRGRYFSGVDKFIYPGEAKFIRLSIPFAGFAGLRCCNCVLIIPLQPTVLQNGTWSNPFSVYRTTSSSGGNFRDQPCILSL